MDLSLHLWTEKVFKAIGDQYGGWLETKEETLLKDHLKWARIKVIGNSGAVPKEVMIEDSGLVFIIPIWCEWPTRVFSEEEDAVMVNVQWVRKPYNKKITRDSYHIVGRDLGEGSQVRAKDYPTILRENLL